MPLKTWQSELKSALVWSVGFFLPLLNDSRLFNLCFNSSHGLPSVWRQAGPEDSHITPVAVLSSPCKTLGITGTVELPKRARSLSPVAEQHLQNEDWSWGILIHFFLLFLLLLKLRGGESPSGLKRLTINQTRDAVVMRCRGGEVRNWEAIKLKPPSEWIIFRKNYCT